MQGKSKGYVRKVKFIYKTDILRFRIVLVQIRAECWTENIHSFNSSVNFSYLQTLQIFKKTVFTPFNGQRQ